MGPPDQAGRGQFARPEPGAGRPLAGQAQGQPPSELVARGENHAHQRGGPRSAQRISGQSGCFCC